MHSCIQSGLCFLSSAFFFISLSIFRAGWEAIVMRIHQLCLLKRSAFFFFLRLFLFKSQCGFAITVEELWNKNDSWLVVVVVSIWTRGKPEHVCYYRFVCCRFFLFFFLITVLFRLILSHLEQQRLTRWRWKTDRAHHRHVQTFPLSVEHSQIFFLSLFFLFFFNSLQ